MKKLQIAIAFALALAGIAYAATLQTAGNQEASKMGNQTLVDIVNANDVALNAELARAVTNATLTAAAPVTNMTGLAAFATNIVAVAPATNIVATETVYTLNYLDTNSAPAVLVFTTRTYAVQSGPVPTLQTVLPAVQIGAAPTITLQRR